MSSDPAFRSLSHEGRRPGRTANTSPKQPVPPATDEEVAAGDAIEVTAEIEAPVADEVPQTEEFQPEQVEFPPASEPAAEAPKPEQTPPEQTPPAPAVEAADDSDADA